MTNPRAHEQRDCPRFYDCLTQAAVKNLKAVPCKECKQQEETEMARGPQVTCSRETYERLEKIRKESKMIWVDFLKLCGVSRSQWDCIRNSKPMGQLVFERIADNLKIDFVWLMFGEGDRTYFPVDQLCEAFKLPDSKPIHDAGYPSPKDKELQAVAEQPSSNMLTSESLQHNIIEESKAVKVMEMYEYKENGRKATIGVKDGQYQHVYVEGINQHKWSLDDVMFLYKATGEVLRLVQG